MSANIKILLGKRIRELRKTRNLTQEQLAERVNIEVPSLSNIENGKNYPNSETIEKLALGLDVRVFELFIVEHLEETSENTMLNDITRTLKGDIGLLRTVYKIVLNLKK